MRFTPCEGDAHFSVAKMGEIDIESRLEGANPHGDRTSICLRKSRFRRYRCPIRNRPCRDAISITIDFSLRTAKPSLKSHPNRINLFFFPPSAQRRRREENEYLSMFLFFVSFCPWVSPTARNIELLRSSSVTLSRLPLNLAPKNLSVPPLRINLSLSPCLDSNVVYNI